jgi:hypothetical protein
MKLNYDKYTQKIQLLEHYFNSHFQVTQKCKDTINLFSVPLDINTFSPAAFKTLKSTVPDHFTTLWKSQSTSSPSGQLAREAAEYYYSVRAESVNTETLPADFQTETTEMQC